MDLLDVTLREGEQRPGHSYTVEQKVEAARMLDDLGVDYVQIGFPIVDDRTERTCERLDLDAKTTGIARAIERDVTAAADASVDVIDLFAPTSDLQREQLLGVTRGELVETIHGAFDVAADTGLEVHFTAMDGFRTDPRFLNELRGELEPRYFTVADTVGARTPRGVTEVLDALDGDLATVGVHFHDDLGVATANALVAADAGVGKVDVSVGGVGERAGNTPLEEFVVAGDVGEEPVETAIDLPELLSDAESVLEALDEDAPLQKSLLGDSVFEHDSGLHTAAMLDDPSTFEPFDPSQFGGERRLLFGKASGRGVARRLLQRAGVEPTESLVDALLERLHSLDHEIGLPEAVDLAADVGTR